MFLSFFCLEFHNTNKVFVVEKKKGLFSRFKTAVFHADKPSGETKEDATLTAEEPNNSQTKPNKKEKKKDKREKSKEKKDVKGNSNQHSPTGKKKNSHHVKLTAPFIFQH